MGLIHDSAELGSDELETDTLVGNAQFLRQRDDLRVINNNQWRFAMFIGNLFDCLSHPGIFNFTRNDIHSLGDAAGVNVENLLEEPAFVLRHAIAVHIIVRELAARDAGEALREHAVSPELALKDDHRMASNGPSVGDLLHKRCFTRTGSAGDDAQVLTKTSEDSIQRTVFDMPSGLFFKIRKAVSSRPTLMGFKAGTVRSPPIHGGMQRSSIQGCKCGGATQSRARSPSSSSRP